MTRYDLMRLFVRLFGLMILVGVVLQLLLSIRMLVQLSDQTGPLYQLQGLFAGVVGYIGAMVPYAIVGICFLWWSGRVIDRASLARGEAVGSVDLRSMEIILVALLGLYLLAEGFADLCRGLIEGIGHLLLLRGVRSSVIWDMQTVFIGQASVKLAVGILLVIRRGGIVAVIHRVHAWVRKWRAWPEEAPFSER